MNQKYKRVALFLVLALVGVAQTAEITSVLVRQRWPWSRKVDIEYVLECGAGGVYDVEIEAYNGVIPLTLPETSLSGALYGVVDGIHRIVWDPTDTPYAATGAISNFRVELTLKKTPLYMIVDLTKTPGEPGQIEYLHEEDLIAADPETWLRNPITNDGNVIESVIWTAVTNGNTYKSDKIALRRVRAGSYKMGTSAKDVVLTKDFYIGVFHLTQGQLAHFDSTKSTYFTDPESRPYRPMDQISFNYLRGTVTGTNWPGISDKGDHRVDAGSFMDLLRKGTGINGFDLPTEAQWEYACRADTTTHYNDGNIKAPADGISKSTSTSNTFIDVLGRYRYNGGYFNDSTNPPPKITGSTNGSAIVGSYLPNAWGLYDMHGNVNTWCLDWDGSNTLLGGTDPVGPVSGEKRIWRGGTWLGTASQSSSAARTSSNPTTGSYFIGCRLVIHLP